MFNIKEKSFAYGKHQVTLSTGKIARQATGSVEVTIGDTVVLVTAVVAKEAKPDQSFFPLTVHYQEKTYAAGKIPGSFFRREARPSEKETLLSRLIDRPIRPLFPKGFLNEVLVMAQVISLDENVQTEVPAMIGASAALALTGAPFQGPIGAAKVGYINGEFILNPSTEEFKNSDLELSVAGTKDAVLMVESEANQLPEDTMLDAVMFGHKQMQVVIDNINELVAEAGKPQWDWTPASTNENLKQLVSDKALQGISEAYQITNKQERQQALRSLRHKIFDKIQAEATEEIKSSDIESEFGALEKSVVRDKIIAGEARIDGRDTTTVRPIECEVGLYPKIHGSALFTRGETQAFVAVTLGTDRDAQLMDDLEGKFDEKFLFHYNFPPYSVGECGRVMGPGRREIGHGKLAKRGIQAVTPSAEEFPYVIRVVSEITESNGSSSMASVCGSSLAMMDAGIPLSNPVSGIAMGLIKEGDKYVVLSDILGDEDHLGDMDFKVAGTEQGITALQMDIKIQGITEEIMQQALKQASDGRKHILGEMAKALSAPKSDLSPYAPRMTSITVATDKIGDVIGKGGSTIRSIQEETGAVVDINDDGVITVSTNNQEAADKAIAIIESLTKDIEADEIYEGKVIKIVDFGAFVSLTPGKDGLLHISEIDNSRVQNVEDFIKEGDTIKVKVISIDRQGKIRLSRKALL
jgi:polyribonucleotide nucleotidyltransferase